MMNLLVRALKRLALLLPGIFIAYVSVRKIFPLFDKQLPLAVAIFFTYVLAAYVLIPALVRVVRVLLPEKQQRLYCITPDGFASDPINIGLIGSRDQLINHMKAVGWYVADDLTLRNMLHHVSSAIFKHQYPTAPMSRLYLFGRKQDIGFEIPLEDERGNRHHVRFWATTFEQGEALRIHSIHWHKRDMQLRGSSLLWVGAASRDTGFGFIRHNVQITHMIDPNTNAERELIASQLLDKKLATEVTSVRLGKPYTIINRVWLGYLSSDGLLKVLKLK